ncbi:hypothetical protein ACHAXS_005049 [Conticribra weissflogii]
MDTTPNSKPKGQVDVARSTYVYRDLASVLPSELCDLDEQTSSMYSCHARVPAETVQSDKLPAKLATMLTDPALADIMTWMPHGRSWKVIDRKAFCRYALPHYCEHSNYQSFVRIVNAWGFRRIIVGRDRDTYYHEMFLRGKPELHERMKRIPSHHKKAPIEKEHKCPDFYELAKVSPLPEVPLRETSELLVIMQTGAEVTPLGRSREKKRKKQAGPSKSHKRNDTRRLLLQKSTTRTSGTLDETTPALEQPDSLGGPESEKNCISHDSTAAKSKSSNPNDSRVEALMSSSEATICKNVDAQDRESLLQRLFSKKASQYSQTVQSSTSEPSPSPGGSAMDHGSLFRLLVNQKLSQNDQLGQTEVSEASSHADGRGLDDKSLLELLLNKNFSQNTQARHTDAAIGSSRVAAAGVGVDRESLFRLQIDQDSSRNTRPDPTETSLPSSHATGACVDQEFLLQLLLAKNSSQHDQQGPSEPTVYSSLATGANVNEKLLRQLLLAKNSSRDDQPGYIETAVASSRAAAAGVDKESHFRLNSSQKAQLNNKLPNKLSISTLTKPNLQGDSRFSTLMAQLAKQNQTTSMYRFPVNGREAANDECGAGDVRQQEESSLRMPNEELINAILAKKAGIRGFASLMTSRFDQEPARVSANVQANGHPEAKLRSFFSNQDSRNPGERIGFSSLLPILSDIKTNRCRSHGLVQPFRQSAVRDVGLEQSQLQYFQPPLGNSFDLNPETLLGARGQAGEESLSQKLGPKFGALESESQTDVINMFRTSSSHNNYAEVMGEKKSSRQSRDQNPTCSVFARNVRSDSNRYHFNLESMLSVLSNEAHRNTGSSVGNAAFLRSSVQDSPQSNFHDAGFDQTAGRMMAQLRCNRFDAPTAESALLSARLSICPDGEVDQPYSSSLNG